MIQNILFDLDGTLVDPKEGITKSIQFALKKLGRKVLPCDQLEWCIGPPLLQIFAELLNTDDQELIQGAISLYRERFSAFGEKESRVYPETEGVLAKLRNSGMNLYVATSKPTVFAVSGLKFIKLDSYFKKIYGSELNGDFSDKTKLISFIIENEGLNPEYTMMIGDREFDIIGARQSGVHSGGVLYGYGTEKELKNAGAEILFASPSEILEYCNPKG